MKKSLKSLLAAMLALVLILTILPAASYTALAADIDASKEVLDDTVVVTPTIISNEPPATDPETGEQTTGYVLIENPGRTSLTDAYLAGLESGADSVQASLPRKYNSKDYGYVTPVRDQGSYGTCWAHGAVASVESYMIKNKIKDAVTGKAAATTMNYSESHMAWFTFTSTYDKLGMLTGDKTTPYGDYRNVGGNGYLSTFTFMRGEGPASETTSALAYSNMSSSGLDKKYAYGYNTAQVTDVEWIPKSNMAAIKQAIMDYGAGEFSYYHDSAYVDNSSGAYYNYSYSGGNHAVTVVGWDDDYSKYNFRNTPSRNGAWIIKNSWGTSYFDKGYIYISYDDVSCPDEPVCFYKVAPKDTYQYIYQYDGTGGTVSRYFNDGRSSATFATIFTANSAEDLEAISVCTANENTKYTLKIYTGCSATNPASGTLATKKSGTFAYQGYHTVPLNETVWLSKNQRYSVVITLTAPEELHFWTDEVDTSDNGFYYTTHTSHANSAFYLSGSSWIDASSTFNFRIKALASPHKCPFKDVVKGKWYYDAVLWAYYHNPRITSGTDETHFSPNQTCTRAQIIAFLWHANNDPTPGGSSNPFTDVVPGKYYYKAVLWAYYHNPQITSGKNANTFGISEPCTRAQVVMFLWAAAGKPNPKTTKNPFTDVSSSAYYYKAVLWAYENGITGGTTATTFSPKQTCTRGQIVTFLYAAYGP